MLVFFFKFWSNFSTLSSENIKISVEELSEIKRISTGHLRLLGFKPLSCLKDYHNLRPSTFIFPSDEVAFVLILLWKCLVVLAFSLPCTDPCYGSSVAFYGSSSHPQLVALIAQLLSLLTGTHYCSI
ncbi:atp-dependent dna helicase 2 subunit ku70 [Quercus suber]|uniref:Atp-dependent dna helicase 2 subunit ku70 n=1 Tax=Quercus suber TaxID=58331 RepID=A0AAW0JLP4_QUESU